MLPTIEITSNTPDSAVELTFVQHPPNISEAIKTIVAHEGTVACVTAAIIPKSFIFALEFTAPGVGATTDPFAWSLAAASGVLTDGIT